MVRQMIRWYPELHKELNDLHQQATTAQLSGMPSSGGSSRSLENIALKQLPRDQQQIHDAVHTVTERYRHSREGCEHLHLIQFMYWSIKPMPMASAALHLHISEPTAKRWHGAFVRAVAKAYGFEVSKDDTPKPK